jgi:hypothetical protein
MKFSKSTVEFITNGKECTHFTNTFILEVQSEGL